MKIGELGVLENNMGTCTVQSLFTITHIMHTSTHTLFLLTDCQFCLSNRLLQFE